MIGPCGSYGMNESELAAFEFYLDQAALHDRDWISQLGKIRQHPSAQLASAAETIEGTPTD